MPDTDTLISTQGETPQQGTGPREGIERLNAFLGSWRLVGQQYEGAVGSAARVTATETYEWLQGGQFLIHRFDGQVGEAAASCIEIIGYNAESQTYPIHSFYDNGIETEWSAREQDGVWTLTGTWQRARPMQVRCTIVFSADGTTRTAKWEASSDGSGWETFWDVEATRVTDR